MPISRLNKYQFDEFNPPRSTVAIMIGEEKSWFVNSDRSLLGVVVLDRTDKDWSFVVLGRDERGEFRGIDMQVSYTTQGEAERELQAKMLEIEQGDSEAFPQGE